MSEIPLTNLLSALAAPSAATAPSALAAGDGMTSLRLTSTLVAVDDNTLSVHIPQQGVLRLPLPQGADGNPMATPLQPGQQLELTFKLEGRLLNITLQPKLPQLPMAAIELPTGPDMDALLRQKFKITAETAGDSLSLPLGQARRLPGERIKLLLNGKMEHLVLQPQAGKLQFNQSYNVGLTMQQGQPRLSFSEIAVPPQPLELKLPVADYHKQNPTIRLDKLVTEAPSGVARLQASDKVAAAGEVSLVVTSVPQVKTPESPLTPLWLKFQPMPGLFKALGETGKELESQIKSAQIAQAAGKQPDGAGGTSVSPQATAPLKTSVGAPSVAAAAPAMSGNTAAGSDTGMPQPATATDKTTAPSATSGAGTTPAASIPGTVKPDAGKETQPGKPQAAAPGTASPTPGTSNATPGTSNATPGTSNAAPGTATGKVANTGEQPAGAAATTPPQSTVPGKAAAGDTPTTSTVAASSASTTVKNAATAATPPPSPSGPAAPSGATAPTVAQGTTTGKPIDGAAMSPPGSKPTAVPQPVSTQGTSPGATPATQGGAQAANGETQAKQSLGQSRLHSLLSSLNLNAPARTAEAAAPPSTSDSQHSQPANAVSGLLRQLQHNLPDMQALTSPERLSPLIQQLMQFNPMHPASINIGALGPLAAALQLMLGAKQMASGDAPLSPELMQHLSKILQGPKKGPAGAPSAQGMQMLAMLGAADKLTESLSNLASNIRLYQYSAQEQSSPQQQIYYFALPTSDSQLPQVEGKLEQQQQDGADEARRGWQLSLILPLGSQGKILAKATLVGKHIDIDFVADNPRVEQDAKQYLDFLGERLATLGLTPGDIRCQQGDIPPTLLKRPHNLVETIA